MRSGLWNQVRIYRGSSPPILSGEMQMIKELDTIVLTLDLPEFGLHAGDLGTVVLVHKHGGY